MDRCCQGPLQQKTNPDRSRGHNSYRLDLSWKTLCNVLSLLSGVYCVIRCCILDIIITIIMTTFFSTAIPIPRPLHSRGFCLVPRSVLAIRVFRTTGCVWNRRQRFGSTWRPMARSQALDWLGRFDLARFLLARLSCDVGRCRTS